MSILNFRKKVLNDCDCDCGGDTPAVIGTALKERLIYRLKNDIGGANGQKDMRWEMCNGYDYVLSGATYYYTNGENTVPNLSTFVSAQARGIIDDMATWFTVLQDCTLNIECQILWDAQNAYQTYQAGVHIRSAGMPDSSYVLANTPTAPTNRMGVFDEVSALSTVTPPLALVNTGQAIHATISYKAGWAFSIYINASASLNIMNSFRGPECISYCAISRVA